MVLNNKQIKSLEKVINYLIDDEEKSYEESGEASDHIYKDLMILKRVVHDRFVTKY
tara:strand:+ start:647 stop:814 length:168 start_codon:yes stop_codon:yes gene_type:complete